MMLVWNLHPYYMSLLNDVVHFTLSDKLLTPKTINFKINVKELKFEKSN